MEKESRDKFDTKLISKLDTLCKSNAYKEYLETLNAALEKVEIHESNEPMVHLREILSPDIGFDLVDLHIDTDNEARLFLRMGVAEKLNEAEEYLPPGVHLLVRDALRTKDMVENLYKLYFDKVKKESEENIPDKEIDLMIRNVLAMPDDPVPPGHMTGAAVDVVLVDDTGARIPMEVPQSEIPKSKQMFTFCDKLPKDILKNRRTLYDAMLKAGFHNYAREYWHYSYGDAYWAVRRKEKIAKYGIPKD